MISLNIPPIRQRRERARRERRVRAARRGALIGVGAVCAAGTAFATARRRRRAIGGKLRGVTSRVRRGEREYDDTTLARKVESELLRPADAPKGKISVNTRDGIVELRGEVKRPEDIQRLGATCAKIEGVRDVHNLLHTPGSPPKHSPTSDPAEVRDRLN